ncbi:MAG: hypothetical protein PHW03_09740 [Eubacteriales bacterium]|nr:hypothetical protein [Eubacteriales bacterium]
MRAIEQMTVYVNLYVIKNNEKEYLTDAIGKMVFDLRTAQALRGAMRSVGVVLWLEEVTR